MTSPLYPASDQEVTVRRGDRQTNTACAVSDGQMPGRMGLKRKVWDPRKRWEGIPRKAEGRCKNRRRQESSRVGLHQQDLRLEQKMKGQVGFCGGWGRGTSHRILMPAGQGEGADFGWD